MTAIHSQTTIVMIDLPVFNVSLLICDIKNTRLLSLFQLGLVCFRAKGSDKLNQKLLSVINDSGKIHMIPARVNQRYTIRFALASPNATESDVGKDCRSINITLDSQFLQGFSNPIGRSWFRLDTAWGVITDFASELLESKVIFLFCHKINHKMFKV